MYGISDDNEDFHDIKKEKKSQHEILQNHLENKGLKWTVSQNCWKTLPTALLLIIHSASETHSTALLQHTMGHLASMVSSPLCVSTNWAIRCKSSPYLSFFASCFVLLTTKLGTINYFGVNKVIDAIFWEQVNLQTQQYFTNALSIVKVMHT